MAGVEEREARGRGRQAQQGGRGAHRLVVGGRAKHPRRNSYQLPPTALPTPHHNRIGTGCRPNRQPTDNHRIIRSDLIQSGELIHLLLFDAHYCFLIHCALLFLLTQSSNINVTVYYKIFLRFALFRYGLYDVETYDNNMHLRNKKQLETLFNLCNIF